MYKNNYSLCIEINSNDLFDIFLIFFLLQIDRIFIHLQEWAIIILNEMHTFNKY